MASQQWMWKSSVSSLPHQCPTSQPWPWLWPPSCLSISSPWWTTPQSPWPFQHQHHQSCRWHQLHPVKHQQTLASFPVFRLCRSMDLKNVASDSNYLWSLLNLASHFCFLRHPKPTMTTSRNFRRLQSQGLETRPFLNSRETPLEVFPQPLHPHTKIGTFLKSKLINHSY